MSGQNLSFIVCGLELEGRQIRLKKAAILRPPVLTKKHKPWDMLFLHGRGFGKRHSGNCTSAIRVAPQRGGDFWLPITEAVL